MAYQSLYRRYRPQRFDEVKGQDHCTRTLRNAVREGRVAHAYLFSGPRGTGKTSTARILAKALNCEAPADGEPCGTCSSCEAITQGRSLDVVELDAASNRGIDAMRDLIGRVSLASMGRWKTYIVDEVHMLTTEAANTLLKTLEEPPPHVVFVLATTEPQKVLATIQSRTQHFEFRLLGAEMLATHLRWVADQAQLHVAPEAIDLVVRRGSGSARDALSALDQVAAAGGVPDEGPGADELVEALCERDSTGAMVAVAECCSAGHDPRQLALEVIERLRDALLVTFDRNLVNRPDEGIDQVEAQARRLGRALTVRAMEELGTALVEMREAPDPRVVLEVSLVRLCRPELDTSPAALLDRIERLERGARPNRSESGGPAPPAADPPGTGAGGAGGAAAPAGPAGARLALGGLTARARPPSAEAATGGRGEPVGPEERPAAAPPPESQPSEAPAGGGPMPGRDELTLAWGDTVLGSLPQKVKARYRAGRFVAVDGEVAVFALPDTFHRQRCVEVQPDVEAALSHHFGRRVRLRLVADGGTEEPAGGPPEDPDIDPAADIDPDELTEAPPGAVASPVDQVLAVFEGAEVVEE